MYLDICEHPHRVKVKLKDGSSRFQYVACGKCNTCRNHRASVWIERLKQESQCHAFTVFFTLTFDEKSLPRLQVDSNYNLVDSDSGLIINPFEEIKDFQPASRLYLARRRNIPYVTVEYAQKFIKRLRFHFENNITISKHGKKDCKKLRYYIVSEYGPSTYRPHLHGLLFFDSRENARCIEQLIRQSWSYGRIDAQFSIGKSAEYVARYCNCLASLPKIYLHSYIRPFQTFSKFPAIGTLQANSKEIREIFENGTCERVIEDYTTHKVKVSPIWRTFEDTLFPKVAGFSTLSHSQRVTLYSVYATTPIGGFDMFISWIEQNKDDKSWLMQYLHKEYLEDLKIDSSFPKFSRLKSLYYTSSRVYYQRRIFGVSLDYYVRKIENYYQKKELWKLKKFYQFQENFVIENNTSIPLLCLYDDAFKTLDRYYADCSYIDRYVDTWQTFCEKTLLYQTFGIDFSSPLSLDQSLRLAERYRKMDSTRMKSLNAKIVFENTKSKKRNDYIQWAKKKDLFTFNIEKKYE